MAPSPTKASLIEALKSVFIAKGFHGATLAELAKATGLSKASLYHHFPRGKNEMAATLIRHAIADCHERAYGKLDAGGTPKQRIAGFLDGLLVYADGGRRHCLLVILSQEALPEPALNTLIHDQFADWEHRLALAYEDLGFKPKKSARLANAQISHLYGALLLAKLHNAPEIFAKTIKRAAKELANH